MNCFVTIYGAPRGSKCPEALLGHDALFNKTMILLHDVVEVLHRPVSATAWQIARALQTGNCRRVGRSEIGVDDAWWRSTVSDRTAKQALRGVFVAER